MEICTFDPFGKGLYRYTFVPEELIHFLKYMEQSTDEFVAQITDESIIRLHEKVTGLKKQRGLEVSYMTFEQLLKEREAEGKIEGKIEAIIELLEDHGCIPEEIYARILKEEDSVILKKWLKLAARVTSIEQFLKEM